jgi:hypothetical protein
LSQVGLVYTEGDHEANLLKNLQMSCLEGKKCLEMFWPYFEKLSFNPILVISCSFILYSIPCLERGVLITKEIKE